MEAIDINKPATPQTLVKNKVSHNLVDIGRLFAKTSGNVYMKISIGTYYGVRVIAHHAVEREISECRE